MKVSWNDEIPNIYIYIYMIYIYIILYGKMKLMFQTTNQSCFIIVHHFLLICLLIFPSHWRTVILEPAPWRILAR